jgi:DNA-directed RNA polymerase sigma subunit (sigma70/sigma32)
MPRYIPSDRRGSMPNGYFAMTLDEIAERLGLSKARVAQLERRAIAKMRRALNEPDAEPREVEAAE